MTLLLASAFCHFTRPTSRATGFAGNPGSYGFFDGLTLSAQRKPHLWDIVYQTRFVGITNSKVLEKKYFVAVTKNRSQNIIALYCSSLRVSCVCVRDV